MKKITKLTHIIVFSSMCAIVTGCASTKITQEPIKIAGVNQPNSVVNQIKDERSMVKVSVSTVTDSELATIVCNNAETYLSENNYSVTKGDADLYLKLDIDESVYDQAGEYVILDGTLSNVLTTSNKSEILARMPEASVRSNRTLGDKAARKEIARKLSDELNAWMGKEISPEVLGIEARSVSIYMRNSNESKDSIYISNFIEKVAKLDGVIDVTLIKHDTIKRNFVINIVLRASKFPEGITNKIMVTYPELKLNFK
ncbi:MAG: hypothetical protein J6V70_08210 [Kiritimatiellae bacterium]|nr:hypothetical protein [Kiritimatiellia bacterium]